MNTHENHFIKTHSSKLHPRKRVTYQTIPTCVPTATFSQSTKETWSGTSTHVTKERKVYFYHIYISATLKVEVKLVWPSDNCRMWPNAVFFSENPSKETSVHVLGLRCIPLPSKKENILLHKQELVRGAKSNPGARLIPSIFRDTFLMLAIPFYERLDGFVFFSLTRPWKIPVKNLPRTCSRFAAGGYALPWEADLSW